MIKRLVLILTLGVALVACQPGASPSPTLDLGSPTPAESPATSPEMSPDETLEASPEETPEESPEESPMETPEAS